MAGTGPATCPFPARPPCGGCLLAAVLAPWAAHNRSCQRGVPLEAEAWPPCEGCQERNQQGPQQKAPLHQLGPLAINRSTALGMGDKLSSLQALPQGHHQRSAKKKQSPFSASLWDWPAPPGLPWAAAAGWHPLSRARADTKATPAVVRLRAIWRFMDRIGAGTWPLTSSSSDRSGCR